MISHVMPNVACPGRFSSRFSNSPPYAAILWALRIPPTKPRQIVRRFPSRTRFRIRWNSQYRRFPSLRQFMQCKKGSRFLRQPSGVIGRPVRLHCLLRSDRAFSLAGQGVSAAETPSETARAALLHDLPVGHRSRSEQPALHQRFHACVHLSAGNVRMDSASRPLRLHGVLGIMMCPSRVGAYATCSPSRRPSSRRRARRKVPPVLTRSCGRRVPRASPWRHP